MSKTTLLSLVALLTFSSVSVLGQTVDDDDTQFWHETKVEFSLLKTEDKNGKKKEKINGIIIGNLRVSDNIGNLSDWRIGFGAKFKAHKNLEITPSYIFRLQSPGQNRYEHRLRLDIVPKVSAKHFAVENRSRFEQRIKTAGRTDQTFYRNRTKLKVPVKNNDKTIFTPFVSNDTYFDLRNTNVFRNDTAAGVSKKWSKNFSTSTFYQYRRNYQSSTRVIHIVGFDLKYKID